MRTLVFYYTLYLQLLPHTFALFINFLLIAHTTVALLLPLLALLSIARHRLWLVRFFDFNAHVTFTRFNVTFVAFVALMRALIPARCVPVNASLRNVRAPFFSRQQSVLRFVLLCCYRCL